MRILLLVLCCPLFSFSQMLNTVSLDTLLMGSAFSFTAVHEDEEICKQAVFSAVKEVSRIEGLISSWMEDSQTSLINNQAGKQAVKVDYELFQLIERSLKISQITNGYFDLSFASIDNIWQFNGQDASLPSQKDLDASVALINYLDIALRHSDTSVFLKQENMKIGFGAIGKGYAADKAKDIMQIYGVINGVVNAGGDLLAWGGKIDGSPWNVGIANPIDKNEIFTTIFVNNQALVTSGDYEKFLNINSERYGHIINPKTGMPVRGLLSVSIVAETAELADALATAVFVLGEKEGMDLINHLIGVEGIVVTDKNKILYSKNIILNDVYETTD